MEEKEEIVALLDGITVADVVASDAFRKALTMCLDVERKSLGEVRRKAAAMGRNIRSNPIDRLRADGAFSVEMFSELFIAIVDKRCLLPATLRQYIRAVCMQAYGKALRDIVEQKRNKKDE